MTQKEYSELMGYERDCSFEEYQQANFIYMMAGDMDKQAFCKEYKKAGHSPLVLELAKAENIIDIALRDEIEKGKKTARTLLREAAEIRQRGLGASADALEKIAADLIGRKECIKWKLLVELPLSEPDHAYIADNLQ